MKPFLTNCFLFGTLALLAFTGLCFLADGYSDAFYLRFTSPRQNALILGSSKAAQDIQPAVLNRALRNEYHQQIYNFGFSIDFSSFGEVYLEAIRKKLNKEIKNSLFIVSVDPWTISADMKAPEDPSMFSEESGPLRTISRINTAPNFPYLLKYYPIPYMTLLSGKIHRQVFNHHPYQCLHEDGWLELSLPMDSSSVKLRTREVLSRYRSIRANHAISGTRIAWLVKTIAFLQQYGDVYLVRLPVHPGMLALENGLCPAFDTTIENIARRQQVPYFNFTGQYAQYNYTDGVHLWKESGALVSKQLADLIIEYRHSR